jgi:hypothetical protein
MVGNHPFKVGDVHPVNRTKNNLGWIMVIAESVKL